MAALHDDELAIDADLVRRLVARSFPELASYDIRALPSTGSTNALYRLGDDLLVRLPRQPGGTATLAKEVRWLPVVAAALSAAVPEVVGVGEPAFGYPERWAVTRWLDGTTPPVPCDPAAAGPATSARLASDLAAVVRELRAIDIPSGARDDDDLTSYRGRPLAELDDFFRESVDTCRSIAGLDLDLDRSVAIWDDAVAAQQDRPPTTRWYHGDLLAENLLVRDGRLVAVLDFGGLSVGDPVVDLVVGWEVLDAAGREAFRREVPVDDAAWATSKGWALMIAMMTFPYYWHTMPARCAARRSMALAVLADADAQS